MNRWSSRTNQWSSRKNRWSSCINRWSSRTNRWSSRMVYNPRLAALVMLLTLLLPLFPIPAAPRPAAHTGSENGRPLPLRALEHSDLPHARLRFGRPAPAVLEYAGTPSRSPALRIEQDFRGLSGVQLARAEIPGDTQQRFEPERDAITNLEMRRADYNNTLFYFSPHTTPEFEQIRLKLEQGIAELDQIFGHPPVDRRPAFWFVADEAEMRFVLNEQIPYLNEDGVYRAIKSRVYRHQGNVYILYRAGTPRAQVLRLVFQVHTDRLIRAVADSPVDEDTVGWFFNGMAAYYAWLMQSRLYDLSPVEANSRILDYYARYFDPEQAAPLAELESWREWKRALQSNPGQVYGQAAIAYLYLARSKNPGIGLTVLRLLENGESFSEAFERATGTRLFEFEEQFKKEMLPEVSRARKSD
ncbi:MAG: hypothetical protein KDK30_00285 [Leptospiraceae bacterium]|nr:hypothetical protein [Leptospiraceae bacterium]